MAFYRFPQISLCSNTYKSMVQRKGTNGPLSTEHVFCLSVDSDQSVHLCIFLEVLWT